jgi:hypothetical protein
MSDAIISRPRVAVARGEWCTCGCHRPAVEGETPAPAINGLAPQGVPRADALAAVTACARCLPHHAVALAGDPVRLDRAWWRWWSEHSPRPVVVPEPAAPKAATKPPTTWGGGDGPE